MKINLGCGHRNFGKDWIHIDGGDYPHLDSNDIITLPFEDNSVDLIYASHVIEYFDREEITLILLGWKDKLKSGGTLRLAVPNFEVMSRLYQEGKYPLDRFLGPLYGKMPMGDEIIYHKTVYDFKSLKKILLDVGFNNINRYDWRDYDIHIKNDDHSQSYLPKMDKEKGTLISLNIETTK